MGGWVGAHWVMQSCSSSLRSSSPTLTGCRLPPAPPARPPAPGLQTLRAYVGMLRMEDRIYAHPAYLKGTSGAISAYLQLADSAAAGGGPGGEEALLADMSPEDQKK